MFLAIANFIVWSLIILFGGIFAIGIAGGLILVPYFFIDKLLIKLFPKSYRSSSQA
jgi:hypothetical protein